MILFSHNPTQTRKTPPIVVKLSKMRLLIYISLYGIINLSTGPVGNITERIFIMELMIAERIKKYRKLRDITQDALAQALGVSPQSISKWECGVSQT